MSSTPTGSTDSCSSRASSCGRTACTARSSSTCTPTRPTSGSPPVPRSSRGGQGAPDGALTHHVGPTAFRPAARPLRRGARPHGRRGASRHPPARRRRRAAGARGPRRVPRPPARRPARRAGGRRRRRHGRRGRPRSRAASCSSSPRRRRRRARAVRARDRPDRRPGGRPRRPDAPRGALDLASGGVTARAAVLGGRWRRRHVRRGAPHRRPDTGAATEDTCVAVDPRLDRRRSRSRPTVVIIPPASHCQPRLTRRGCQRRLTA